ncbi:MAG: LysM peptidoglycan-binding domain-containing protein [Actinomycetota bacterium]|nr:LysM peptidoglycan-binding domain-containing protein [Actinomycetota bacterium]
MQKKWLVSVLAGAAVLLSACGDPTTATGSSVVDMTDTAYATLPTTAATLPPTTLAGGPAAGTQTTEITEYTVVEGDTQFTVANRFGVTLDALNLANADTAGYSAFYVGLKIKIPVGAIIPAVTTTVPGTGTTVAATPATAAPTTLPANDSGCTPGSHVIVEGDLPGTVAAKYDVTLAQLEAANANTPGYKNFIVGVKIIIPCA